MTIVRHIFDPATGRAIFVTPDDPSITGLDGPIGSLANRDTTGNFYSKFGPALTDWSQFAASSGFLPLSGGSLNPSAGLTVPGAFVAQGTVAFTNRPTTGGVTYMLTGDNAASATKLATARAINGVNFDGTAPITIAAAAGTLTGATLASNILASSLTSVGTLLGLNVNGALAQTGGQFTTAQQAVSGSAVSGFGGGWVSKDDGGTNRWAAGVLGAAGARAYQIYDIVNARASFAIDATTGMTSIGLGLNVAGGITGTLLTSAQPNVTSLGTLAGLTVTANALFSNGLTTNSGPTWTNSSWARALSLNGINAIGFGITQAAGVKRFLLGQSGGVLYFGIADDDTATSGLSYPMSITGSSGLISMSNGLSVTGALNAVLTTAAQPNITSLGTLSSLVVSGFIWAGASTNGVVMASGLGVNNSIVAGSQLTTQGVNGGNLNLFARADTGTLGQGVVVSYYDSTAGAWRAALDVRNTAGLATVNLNPAGGPVVTGADLYVGAILVLGGGTFAQKTGGANGYMQLFDGSGGSAVHLGGTQDPANYYSNTTHHFRSRAGVDWVTLTASLMQLVVPQYILSDAQSFTMRAATSGATVYMAFQNSAAARRGYFGFGLGSSPNMYINNDEAGPIILQPNGGTPTASFATSGITFNYGTTVTGTSSSVGSSAGFSWADRVSGASWLLYSSSGIARLWNSTNGDMLTVNTAGLVTFGSGNMTGNLSIGGLLDLAATGVRVAASDAGMFTAGNLIYLAQRSTGAGLAVNFTNGSASFSGTLSVASTFTAPTMTAGTFATQGLLRISDHDLWMATVPGDSAYTGGIWLREAGHAASASNTGSQYAPKIAFHWGGIVASQIAIESNGPMAWRGGAAGQTGRIAIINNPGTGYESLAANTLSLTGDCVVNVDTYVNQGARGYGIVGVYDPLVYRLVYAMGGSYRMATDGSTLGSLYGAFYAYDATSGGKNISGHNLSHGMGIAINGVVYSYIGAGIWTSGPVYGADFILNSDARLKQNLSRIDRALDRLDAMTGYTYEMIADPRRRRSGVMAQQVARALPEAVFTDDLGMMGVAYDALIPVIIEGMKELRAEVSALRRSA